MAKNIAESNTPRGKDLLLVRNNVRHVCLVDLDNASNFFELCDNGRTSIIPEGTFIWCFCGCNTQLSRAIGKSLTFYTLLMKQFVEIDHTPFNRGDAASIALAMTAGQLHQELPMYIPFTILTSEAAFSEVRPRLVGRHVCHTRAKTTLQMKEALHQSFSSDLLEGNCSPSSPRIESVTQEHVNFTSKQRHSDVQIEPVGSITNVPRMVPHSVKETQPNANHQLNAAPQQKQLSHRTYQSIRTSIPSSSLTTSTQVHQENIPQPYVSHMTPRPQEKSHYSNESVEKAEQKTHSVDPTPANDSSSKFAAGVGSEKVYRKYRSPWEQSDLLKSEPKPKIVQCLIPRTQPNVVHTQVLTNSAQISHGSQLNAPKIEDTNFPFSGEIPVSAPVSCTQVKNFMTTTPHAVPKRPRLLDF